MMVEIVPEKVVTGTTRKLGGRYWRERDDIAPVASGMAARAT